MSNGSRPTVIVWGGAACKRRSAVVVSRRGKLAGILSSRFPDAKLRSDGSDAKLRIDHTWRTGLEREHESFLNEVNALLTFMSAKKRCGFQIGGVDRAEPGQIFVRCCGIEYIPQVRCRPPDEVTEYYRSRHRVQQAEQALAEIASSARYWAKFEAAFGHLEQTEFFDRPPLSKKTKGASGDALDAAMRASVKAMLTVPVKP